MQVQRDVSLVELLAGIAVVDPIHDQTVTGLQIDSRQVQAGDLFIAYKGLQSDGRSFIQQAIANGATAIIVDGNDQDIEHIDTVPIFYAKALAAQIGKMASRFYGHPSRRVNVIGVTGTNGKTSCTHYIAEAFSQAQIQCGVIGTIGYGVFPKLRECNQTTPGAIDLQQMLADFLSQGLSTVAMEVTSHALEQYRVKQIEFNTAIFTNLTRDHLDYHGSMEAYGAAKQKLFGQFGLKHAVINIDDAFGQTLFSNLPSYVNAISFGIENSNALINATDVTVTENGFKTKVNTPWGSGAFQCDLLGRFTVSNVLSVLATLCLHKIELPAALKLICGLHGVNGRMQLVQTEGQATFVVDYAHTPDALEKALIALREHCSGELWCVFGCGGDRDQGKRKLMARVAEMHADHVILTDDNPRFEAPQKILSDILDGFQDKHPVIVEHDRKAAIQYAFQKAAPADMILVAGKGHEAYQQYGENRIDFSDLDYINSLLTHKK